MAVLCASRCADEPTAIRCRVFEFELSDATRLYSQGLTLLIDLMDAGRLQATMSDHASSLGATVVQDLRPGVSHVICTHRQQPIAKAVMQWQAAAGSEGHAPPALASVDWFYSSVRAEHAGPLPVTEAYRVRGKGLKGCHVQTSIRPGACCWAHFLLPPACSPTPSHVSLASELTRPRSAYLASL